MGLIAIVGGIGSGKSVVSRILRLRGFGVFDCDYEARCILESPESDIRRAVCAALGEDVFPSGGYDRRRVSEIIFSDTARREALNAVVHDAVRRRLREWACVSDRNVYVECAIAAQSGILDMVEEVILVECDEKLRLSRVASRDGHPKERILAVMRAQQLENRKVIDSGLPVTVLHNDGLTPLLSSLPSAC